MVVYLIKKPSCTSTWIACLALSVLTLLHKPFKKPLYVANILPSLALFSACCFSSGYSLVSLHNHAYSFRDWRSELKFLYMISLLVPVEAWNMFVIFRFRILRLWSWENWWQPKQPLSCFNGLGDARDLHWCTTTRRVDDSRCDP